MKMITVPDLKALIKRHGFRAFMRDLITYLRQDFARWNEFHKIPRVPATFTNGVIELMPIWDSQYYSVKYVNGHPDNPKHGKQTVIGLGILADVHTGYPLLLSEMTVLTAFRTAATSALAVDLLANPEVRTAAIIGTGAQSAFQILAQTCVRPLQSVRYFDISAAAMTRFAENLAGTGVDLIPCDSAAAAVQGADIITLATASAGHHAVIADNQIQPGVHINAIGGDSPGKTELPRALLKRAHIVVEFLEQSRLEGEIQQLAADENPDGELWEYVTARKTARLNTEDITIFDSVGFALEDYSTLRLLNDLCNQYQIGTMVSLIPELSDPKDLISVLGGLHRG